MALTPDGSRAALHLVPPNGGGVDRCVRDLVALRPADWIVHVTREQWVLERPHDARFLPLSPTDAPALVSGGGLGWPLLVHAHSTTPEVREAARHIAADTGAPIVLTLHDIWFADAELPADERQARLDFVAHAHARTAPSRFIIEHLAAALQPTPSCALVPNGAAPSAEPAPALSPVPQSLRQAWPEGGFPLAVIGALGQHKGLRALEALLQALPPGMPAVVMGYTEHNLQPGWALDGRLWVHGPFDPSQLPALVERYRPRLALFPPGMPESFSYALTDAWTMGLTVLVPQHGALGERVARHGGGESYPPDLSPMALAERVQHLLQATPRGPADGARVALREPLPTADDMMSAMTAVYDALPPSPPSLPAVDPALQLQAQQQLDGRFFRLELLNLQSHLDATRDALVAEQQRLASTVAEARALRQHLEAAQAEQARLQAEQARLQAELEAARQPPPPLTPEPDGWLRRLRARLGGR